MVKPTGQESRPLLSIVLVALVVGASVPTQEAKATQVQVLSDSVLEIMGWVNETSGHQAPACSTQAGQPVWINISLQARAWNGTPPFRFSWQITEYSGGPPMVNLSGQDLQYNLTGRMAEGQQGVIWLNVTDASARNSGIKLDKPWLALPAAACGQPSPFLALLIPAALTLVAAILLLIVSSWIIRRRSRKREG
ncbi:MAG: hypothetical protein KGJ23_11300 [Euryarchaeota archaeon]|nr:hypothetical protein [Euryarchaeota archaeon]MDE1837180.1 hypothetical protein [Euryarchaeota archaeon]MDE1881694.1 hypothetical protein [Euryarchaeota archaeon]MDE2045336.1 hypothetical protein [Thermoplasmata archaeon]